MTPINLVYELKHANNFNQFIKIIIKKEKVISQIIYFI